MANGFKADLKPRNFFLKPRFRLVAFNAVVECRPLNWKNRRMRVLLIEDDELLGSAVRDHVIADGHAVDWMRRLDDATAATDTTDYDLILLDLMLPDGMGTTFLTQQRGRGNTSPVIILTARDQVSDRIEGLNAGADDYLVKPFDLAELSARIAAVARRYAGNPNPVSTFGDVTVDLAARKVAVTGKSITLTAREWAIFEALVAHPGAIVSKSQLEDRLYDFNADVESNTVEVHVSNLRKKVGKGLIETVRGMGYRLISC